MSEENQVDVSEDTLQDELVNDTVEVSNEDNLEDDTVLLEDETEIDPAADAGIKTPEDGEEEY